MIGDNPIQSSAEDRLDRLPFAQTLAGELRHLDPREGCVVGILGPWGSGKTSLINLTVEQLQTAPAYPVIYFNPWMFSGADQLVERFFQELAAQLRIEPSQRLSRIADLLDVYGEVVAPIRYAPVVGPWFERVRGANKALKKVLDARKAGADKKRSEVNDQLKKLDVPIVVVVDDIDRLTMPEIRDIFKLVRLTANFPNVIYLLAFDRNRVELALSEPGLDGRHYLEKIVQVIYDMPGMSKDRFHDEIIKALDVVVSYPEVQGNFERSLWPDVYFEIIKPLLSTMRDLRRYAASIRGTLVSIQGRIEVVDILAIEAIRLFLPTCFSQIIQSADLIVGGRNSIRDNREIGRSRIQEIAESSGGNEEIVHALFRRVLMASSSLVPGGTGYGTSFQKSWLREGRLTHPTWFAFYVERIAGADLIAFTLAEQVMMVLSDEQALEALLTPLGSDELGRLMTALEAFEGKYPLGGIEPGVKALLSIMTRVQPRQGGLFRLEGHIVVGRVIARLFKQLPAEEVDAVVSRCFDSTKNLWQRWQLLILTGHQEGAGLKLISQSVYEGLSARFRTDIMGASPDQLANEPEILTMMQWAANGQVIIWHYSDALDVKIVRDALSSVRSQTMGNRAVSERPVLSWELLVGALGDETSVRKLVRRLRSSNEEDVELMGVCDLIDRYLGGWRPPAFGSALDTD